MLQVNDSNETAFSCDLLTTEYDEQLLEAIIALAMSDIPFTCDGASAMVCLRWQLEIIVSFCMSYHWKGYSEMNCENQLKIG